MFIDDLTDYLIEWMTSYRDIIICGGFKMHIDDLNDIEAQIFNDTVEVLGLQQHVNFKTNCAGNTLNLLFTEKLLHNLPQEPSKEDISEIIGL